MKRRIAYGIFAAIMTWTSAYAGDISSNNPKITLEKGSYSITEGNNGSKYLDIKVSADICPDFFPVKIHYYTQDGSANVGEDYESQNGTLTFNVGSCVKTRTIRIKIYGDTDYEIDENLLFKLENGGTNTNQNFHFGIKQATVTIDNDDVNDNADLAVTKEILQTPTHINDPVVYKITATNYGPAKATIEISDTLNSRLTYDSYSLTPNLSDFSCFTEPPNSQGKTPFKCRGAHRFDPYESVTITLRCKATGTSRGKIFNQAKIKSIEPLKRNDPITSNNKSKQVYYRLEDYDLKVVKDTENGKYVYHAGDIIKFRIKIQNQQKMSVHAALHDPLDPSFEFVSVSPASGGDFSCAYDPTAHAVDCGGTKELYVNDKQYVYIQVRATRTGHYRNTATVTSPDDNAQIHDYKPSNNSSSYDVYVVDDTLDKIDGIDKKKDADRDTDLRVGDTITFTVWGRNRGLDGYVKITDIMGSDGKGNKTTKDAFEYIPGSITVDTAGNNKPMTCQYHTPSSDPNEAYIECISDNPLHDKESFSISYQVRLKKSGKLCNYASYYKLYPNDGPNDWIYRRRQYKCVRVKGPQPPKLTAHTFIAYVNHQASFNLQDYTTDPDTPLDQLRYTLKSGALPDGMSLDQNGTIYGIPTTIDLSGVTFTVRVQDPDGKKDTGDFTIIVKPMPIELVDDTYTVYVGMPKYGNVFSNDSGDELHVTNFGLLTPISSTNGATGTMEIFTDGSFAFEANQTEGDIIYSYSAEDKYNQHGSALITFHITKPEIDAKDDVFTAIAGVPIYGDLFADNGNGADIGSGITVVSHTNPSHGSVTIDENGTFSYTSDGNFTSGVDRFSYTIEDIIGQRDEANVTISVSTAEGNSSVDFYLVNPPETRNIIGDYRVLGNTNLCITDYNASGLSKNDPYDIDAVYHAPCSEDSMHNNNNYVSRFIDVDDDNNTWNSSSSTFTLPDNYDQKGGKGIVWAGLFWQGNVNNYATGGIQRRPIPDGTGFDGYKYITQDEAIDITESGAKKVLIRVDNGDYVQIDANTFYYKEEYGKTGGNYAAFANVTPYFQDLNLSKGEHTVTVANILANEGQERILGDFGGWSLVVIYLEDPFNHGEPRNISVYNGFLKIGGKDQNALHDKEIPINGIKLPSTGDVKSLFSAFVGEGEKYYVGDKMYIKNDRGDIAYMPVESNTTNTNIFDSHFTGVDRPSGNDNDLDNTDSIDIDIFDTSSKMKQWRDLYLQNDSNLTSVIIGVHSGGDDVTLSMLAFSAQLYKPTVCYDYTLSIGGYVIPSIGNRIKTNYGGDISGQPLTTHVAIRTKESDFPMTDVNVSYAVDDTSQLTYIEGTTQIAPYGSMAYRDASDLTTDESLSGFTLYLGKGAGQGQGGTIEDFETHYFKFDDNMSQHDINTSFRLWMSYKINYGAGDLTLYKYFDANDTCEVSDEYRPIWGMFNVASSSASTGASNFGKPYNLYTQVAQKDYNITIFSFKEDANHNFTLPNDLNTSIEYEIFNADFFHDTNLSCHDPDSNMTEPKFARFRQQAYIRPDVPEHIDVALKNAGYRIWYLESNGTVVEHHCTSRNADACFKDVYAKYYRPDGDKYCNGIDDPGVADKDGNGPNCSSGGSHCYECLRENYGRPVCSRDNFAIRPEAFYVQITDTNNTALDIATVVNPIVSNISPAAEEENALTAGYPYYFDINATGNQSTQAVRGYAQTFSKNNPDAVAEFSWTTHAPGKPSPMSDETKCNDTSDQNLSDITIFDGRSVDINGSARGRVDQVGIYAFALQDRDWTQVDWKADRMTHHNPLFFDTTSDCAEDNDTVPADSSAKNGCLISSSHIPASGSPIYRRLYLRFYPYCFYTDNLQTRIPNSLGFIYYNTLDPDTDFPYGYRNSPFHNMAFVVQGTVDARGFDENGTGICVNGTVLSNFVNGCYAEDINATVHFKVVGIGTPPPLSRMRVNLSDYNGTAVIYPANSKAEANATNGTPAYDSDTSLQITQPDDGFLPQQQGSVNLKLAYNFDRTINTPINPAKVMFDRLDFNKSVETVLPVEGTQLTVGGRVDFNDTNVTFIYGRAKPEKYFYEDIVDTFVVTPVSVTGYCDLGHETCSQFGIDWRPSNEWQWWIVTRHTPLNDGNVSIKVDQIEEGGGTITLGNTNSFSQGRYGNISVSRNQNATLPLTVDIGLDIDQTVLPYTNRWLIYNENANSVPAIFYKVRFIGNGGWSGYGKTQNVVGGDINDKRPHRMEW